MPTDTALTYEERCAFALDALVNWCWNTEKHLREARRLNAERVRLPILRDADGRPHVYGPNRRWVGHCRWLIARMERELSHAEPETMQVEGGWVTPHPDAFLAAIPDAD